MTNRSIRLFEQASHAKLYSKYRPTYPKAILQAIKKYIARHAGGFELAIDVASGSGQSTFYLRDVFHQCIGIDISEAQIKEAKLNCEKQGVINVHFKVGDAMMNLPVDDVSADAITVATAYHFFDPESFYSECKHILKPNGCLGIYGYSAVQLENKKGNELIDYFYNNTLRKYWHSRKGLVDEHYRSVVLPFKNVERTYMRMSYMYTLSDFIGYLSSWSSYRAYLADNPESRALEELKDGLRDILANEVATCVNEESTTSNSMKHEDMNVEAYFPLFLILGQKI